MKKTIMISMVVLIVAMGGVAVAAKPDVSKNETKKAFKMPKGAVEVSPDVFYLGKAMDKGKVVEGYAFVHKKDKNAKTVCGNGICEKGESPRKCEADCGSTPPDPDPDPTLDTSSCYEFLAKSAKWKTAEPFLVNPTNLDVTASSALSIFAESVSVWETAANFDLAGDLQATGDILEMDEVSPDGVNEVYFGSIADEGTIAVTMIWGIFGGTPRNRELVEWDQVYDEVDFVWSDIGEAGKMDLLSIATHEMGHSFGLGDLYDSACSDVTMYGYASEGETNKRTLEDGDINGMQKLYQ